MNIKDFKEIVMDTYKEMDRNNFSIIGMPDEPMWEEPTVGIAAANSPYYGFFKEHIGEFHQNPEEIYALKYGEVDRSTLRAISIVFPQNKKSVDLQGKAKKIPCDNWLVSRGEWEGFIKEFSEKLIHKLEDANVKAVSVELYPEVLKLEQSEDLGVSARWSHRHNAFVAGMGTFGLSGGLITEKGKAVRLTSLIVEADFPVTPRDYIEVNDWCLYYQDGSCGECLKRCPVSAISTEEKNDKVACDNYEKYISDNYPKNIDKTGYVVACGLCQGGVPCSRKRP